MCIFGLLPKLKKEARQVNSLNFKKGNIGMANMQRRQDRDGLVMMAR